MEVLSRCILDTVPRCHVSSNMVAVAVLGLYKICVFVTTEDCENPNLSEKGTPNSQQLAGNPIQKEIRVDREMEKETVQKAKWTCMCFMITGGGIARAKHALDFIPRFEEVIEDENCEMCSEPKLLFFWNLLIGMIFRRWIMHAMRIHLEEIVTMTKKKAQKLMHAVKGEVDQNENIERSKVRLRISTFKKDEIVSALGWYMDMDILKNERVEDLGHCNSPLDLFKQTPMTENNCYDSFVTIELSSEECGSSKREEREPFPFLDIDSLLNDETSPRLLKRNIASKICGSGEKRKELFSRLAPYPRFMGENYMKLPSKADDTLKVVSISKKTLQNAFPEGSKPNLTPKKCSDCKSSVTHRACFMCSVIISNQQYRLDKRRYGILSRCDHVFCYGCIRSVSQLSGRLVGPVTCPECGVVSETVAASSRWIGDPFKKRTFFEEFYNETKHFR